MTPSLVAACVWGLCANVVGLLPSRHAHWPAAYVLVTLGLPILVLVVYENGVWVALLVLAAAVSILRWPVLYLIRWLSRLVASSANS